MSEQESQIYKGIAIILMLFHHLFNNFEEYAGYTVNYWPFTAQKVQLFAVLSKICVAVFVFITGYGLAASFQKECAPALASSDGASQKKNCLFSFTWKRWWRLMTNYRFIFVLVLLLQPLGRTIFDAYGTGTKQIAVSGIIDFLGLADLFHTPTLNPTWWYVSLAVILLVMTPLLLCLVKKIGMFPATASCFLLLAMMPQQTSYFFYLFSLLAGIFAFETGLLTRIRKISSRPLHAVIALGSVGIVLVGMKLRLDFSLYGLTDAVIVLFGALAVMEIAGRIPLIRTILFYLGKYSMNMFFFHTMLYSYYFKGLYYSGSHWLLILAVLTATSFLASWAIEKIKHLIRYDQKMEQAGATLARHLIKGN